MRCIEKIEKERKVKLARLDLSIKTTEHGTKFCQDGSTLSRSKRVKKNGDRNAKIVDEYKVQTFLDRQVEGYRKTLQLLSRKERREDPFVLMTEKAPEAKFDAYFPPISKQKERATKKG